MIYSDHSSKQYKDLGSEESGGRRNYGHNFSCYKLLYNSTFFVCTSFPEVELMGQSVYESLM